MKKAKSAVRHGITDMQQTLRAVMAIVGLGERVRFERQIEDLDYLYDDIIERLETVREPELRVGREHTRRYRLPPEQARGGG
jgi:hypothetical protein